MGDNRRTVGSEECKSIRATFLWLAAALCSPFDRLYFFVYLFSRLISEQILFDLQIVLGLRHGLSYEESRPGDAHAAYDRADCLYSNILGFGMPASLALLISVLLKIIHGETDRALHPDFPMIFAKYSVITGYESFHL
jgi:hypothetical protein